MNWESLPTINAGRISLRWISADDLDALYTIFSNPVVMRYWSTPPLPDRDAAAKLLSDIHDGFHQQSYLKWGLTLADNKLIGTVTLFHLDFDHRRAEIGYALDRAHWGKGYMGEALRAVIDYSFRVLELHRLEADVDPRNDASIRTLERLGFQREGYLRERWQVDGEIQDALFYGLIRPDWENLQSKGRS